MKYIAYGSNMSFKQMKRLCPNAEYIGTGLVLGMRLEFYRHATLERSDDKDACVPVAVWEITTSDEEHLDMFESFPDYYVKEELSVHMDDGSEVKGMAYLMVQKCSEPPYPGYYDFICLAYADLGLGSEIERVLKPALKRSYRNGGHTVT